MKIATWACASLMMVLAQLAGAQAYPTKAVRLVAGGTGGSVSDTAARVIVGPLTEIWNKQVVVEDRPSVGGVAAAGIVAKATPDGHTLLICSIGTHGIGPVLHKTLPYDHIKDFAPVSRIGTVPNALVAHPSLPVKSVEEFIAYAKANSGKVPYGSSGVGNSPHLSMELLRSMTGINIVHVPFGPNQPLAQQVVNGRVMVAFSNLPGQLPLIKAGKVQALAVTSAKRNPQLPDVPTLIESGIADFEVTAWSGICAPGATPKPIITKINADIVKVLNMPDTLKAFAQRGMDVASSTPGQFAAFIKAENARWAKVAKSAGIEPK